MPHQELETSFVFQPVWNQIVYYELANVVQFKENELYDQCALFLLQGTFDQSPFFLFDLHEQDDVHDQHDEEEYEEDVALHKR